MEFVEREWLASLLWAMGSGSAMAFGLARKRSDDLWFGFRDLILMERLAPVHREVLLVSGLQWDG